MSLSQNDLLDKVKQYAKDILTTKIPEELAYHSFTHTEDVVNAVLEIGRHNQLSESELNILELSAWFHDLGYRDSVDNHEEKSVTIAEDFLKEHQCDGDTITMVKSCILATQMPQNPENILGKIICDADLLHLSTPKYFHYAELLKTDIEFVKGIEISEQEWLKMNIGFFKSHHYFTDYVKENYGQGKVDNLAQLESMVTESKEEKKVSKKELKKINKELKEKLKNAKGTKPDRGVETMFRLTSKNHLELSAMADNKANILISINSIIISVLVTVLLRKLEDNPHMVVPTIIFTAVCLVTIVISILATRPNISSGKFNRDDIKNKKTNLLFFGNFHNMTLQEYEWGMKEMLKDAEYLYGSLIKDIYFLGKVLGKKYKLLRLAYTVFMYGFVLSILSFVVAETFFKH